MDSSRQLHTVRKVTVTLLIVFRQQKCKYNRIKRRGCDCCLVVDAGWICFWDTWSQRTRVVVNVRTPCVDDIRAPKAPLLDNMNTLLLWSFSERSLLLNAYPAHFNAAQKSLSPAICMAECMNNFHGVEVWTAVIALDKFCQLAKHTHRCIAHLVLVQHFDELHVAIASPFWMVALVTA